MSRIIAYTYYNTPWKMESGDTVRIHMILSTLARSGHRVVVFNLSGLVDHYVVIYKDGVIYINLPRKFYRVISRILRWREHYDLNPLIKLTHYIDEFITAIKLYNELTRTHKIIVFGSMSLSSFIIRLLGLKSLKILFDTFGNHAQTLYLRSRKSLKELFRYGLYLALHKLQLKSSDTVIYPCKIDLHNAAKMFKLTKTSIIPNLSPICYNNMEEYLNLRHSRADYSKPYFILMAGSRVSFNKEVVETTIKVFNELPPEKFRLFITGPWLDMRRYVKNPSIELLGVVSKEKLKELLAIADYGLSPVFSHATGTFLKVLSYISAGLDIIASPYSIIGINIPIGVKVYLVRNREEFAELVKEVVHRYTGQRRALDSVRSIVLCKNSLPNVEAIKIILSS